MLNEIMGFSFEGLDLKKEVKELKPTSKCFKDYTSSLKKTGNCKPATVNGYPFPYAPSLSNNTFSFGKSGLSAFSSRASASASDFFPNR